jgi:hypothetical protein
MFSFYHGYAKQVPGASVTPWLALFDFNEELFTFHRLSLLHK